MAKKKKAAKKRTKAKRASARIAKPVKRAARSAKKKTSKKSRKKKAAPKKRTSRRAVAETTFGVKKPPAYSGRQAGDLQGLSSRAGADSESVDELVEEGNAFEAGAISGVEEADDSEGQEVHTHEVPEDDVPGEYLDED